MWALSADPAFTHAATSAGASDPISEPEHSTNADVSDHGQATAQSAVPVYEAFRAEVVVQSFAKLECICAWQDFILAALSDGSLLFLKAADEADGQGARQWQVIKAHRGADRRPVTQLCVVAARPLLLSLTEEGVNLHTLPGMSLKCQTQRCRGAACFAWNEERSTLAVAVKRKVLFFTLSGADLREQSEHLIPEPVTVMAWAGDHLFIGGRRHYSTLNPANGTVAEVCPTGSGTTPSILVTPSNEVLLTRESSTHFYSVDGKASRRAPLPWTEAPVGGIACSAHYAVALQPKAIEVRSLLRVAERHVLQQLGIPGARAIAPVTASDGGLLVILPGDGGIRRLVPVPLDEQATTLARMGEFTEALELCSLMPESEAGQRREVEDRLRIQYGHHMFAEGEFDEGMAQFSLCSYTPPLVLLRLFPSLVATKRRALLPDTLFGERLPEVTEPSGEAYRTGVALLLPYLMSRRSRLIATRNEEGRRATHSAAPSSQPAINIAAQIAASTPAGQVSPSTSLLNKRMSRQNTAAAPVGSLGDDAALRGEPGAAARPATGSGHDHDVDPLLALAVIDSAIVKIMVVMPDTGALLRFVQQHNHIDLEDGEQVLSSAGMYAELAALYKYNGQHAKGLQVLFQCSQDPASLVVPPRGAATDLQGLPGVWAAVRYLVSLNAADALLIQQHCKWVLQADPEAGLQAFLQMRPPLNPSLVLTILSQTSRHYCAMYLETALQIGVALPQDYHNELLLIYLQDILQPAQQRLAAARAAAAARARHDTLVQNQHQQQHHRSRSSLADMPSATGATEADLLFPDELLFPDGSPSLYPLSLSASPLTAADPSSLASDGHRVEASPSNPATAARGQFMDLPMPRSSPIAAAAARTPCTTEAAEDEPITSSELYKRLKDLVYTSPYIDPEYVLIKLPAGELLEIRALMLERLNRHREALQLYVHAMRDISLAESYCDRVYDIAHRCEASGVTVGPRPILPFGRKPGDIYLELVQAILDGPVSKQSPTRTDVVLDASTWNQLSWLLSRKCDRVDPMQVLQMLPESVRVADVLPFVSSMLHFSVENKRKLSVIRHLRRLENLAVREESVSARQQRVVITTERLCCHCYKRIGNSAFVAYPQQQLAHYLCYKRAAGTGAAMSDVSGGVPPVIAVPSSTDGAMLVA